MCYSALVEQDAKKLAARFGARVRIDLFQELLQNRLQYGLTSIDKRIDEFVLSSSDPEFEPLKNLVRDWRAVYSAKLLRELEQQEKRYLKARSEAESGKSTLKIQNELRISQSKVMKLKTALDRLTEPPSASSIGRVFPFQYVSAIMSEKGKDLAVGPARYHLRPRGQDASFDRTYSGCYNARFDSLDRVAWWRESFTQRHGLIQINAFFENVPSELFASRQGLGRKPQSSENLVLKFSDDATGPLLVPVLWDVWVRPGQMTLYSCAIITDEPLPEVARAGHDRTPIFLHSESARRWLEAVGDKEKSLEALNDRVRPALKFQVIEGGDSGEDRS